MSKVASFLNANSDSFKNISIVNKATRKPNRVKIEDLFIGEALADGPKTVDQQISQAQRQYLGLNIVAAGAGLTSIAAGLFMLKYGDAQVKTAGGLLAVAGAFLVYKFQKEASYLISLIYDKVSGLILNPLLGDVLAGESYSVSLSSNFSQSLSKSIINRTTNVNSLIGSANTNIQSLNTIIKTIGINNQFPTLSNAILPSRTFTGSLSPEYVSSVQIISSDFGSASIARFPSDDIILILKFNSPSSQNAKMRITYNNPEIGATETQDFNIKIIVKTKAIINYTKNNLFVNFDSTGPQDPNMTGLTYSWDFGDSKTESSSTSQVTHLYENKGTYEVKLIIENQSGEKITATESISVAIAGITHVTTGRDVDFTLSDSYTIEGTKLSYLWDFGDGQTLTTTSKTVHHAFPDLLGREISVKLLDENLNVIDRYSDYINNRSGSNLTYFQVNRNVRFTLESIIGYENASLTYKWDFGDGKNGTSSDSSIVHSYLIEGTYHVTVDVFDSNGRFLFNETTFVLTDQSSNSFIGSPITGPGAITVAEYMDRLAPLLSPTTKVGFTYEVNTEHSGICYSKGVDYFFYDSISGTYGIGNKYVYMPLYNCSVNDDYFLINP